MKYVLMDIDGCLSDDGWRRNFLPNYDEYHVRCSHDAANPEAIGIAKRVMNDSSATLVIITGRPESYFEKTMRWLKGKLGGDEFLLIMRPESDHRPSPQLKVEVLCLHEIDAADIIMAFDDREDVCAAYKEIGIREVWLMNVDGRKKFGAPVPKENQTARLLRNAAATIESRNAEYKDNWRDVPEVMKALFPDGIDPELVTRPEWHLFELMIVKATRFVNSGMIHKDSIHDLGIYAFMIESILEERENEQ